MDYSAIGQRRLMLDKGLRNIKSMPLTQQKYPEELQLIS